VPDILLWQRLGSGLPISGIAARRDLMERCSRAPTRHLRGNAVACAAAAATVQVCWRKAWWTNAARQGQRLMAGLRALQVKYPVIGEVRASG